MNIFNRECYKDGWCKWTKGKRSISKDAYGVFRVADPIYLGV